VTKLSHDFPQTSPGSCQATRGNARRPAQPGGHGKGQKRYGNDRIYEVDIGGDVDNKTEIY
jgi:hypothetical protein